VSIDSSPIFLQDVATAQAVHAELLDGIAEQQLTDWEDHWKPSLDETVKSLRRAGIERAHWPQSRHWDWRRKVEDNSGSLANPSFCVVCNGMTQGLMILDTLRSARLQSQAGKSMIYVEYLEVAPWNRRHFGDEVPRFRAVGSVLMRAAIEFSYQEGFKGRVGLHSLPQSNGWYANTCGMTGLGTDPDYQNLQYFEMTPEMAEAFITKGNTP
jgi:hypothetical protein